MDLSPVLKENIFYDLLFSHSSELASVSKQMMKFSKLFMGVIFVLGAIWEFFTENRYRELLVRAVLALIILSCYERFLSESLKVSFLASEKILKKNSKNNYFVKGFKKARETAKKELSEREKKITQKEKGKVSWWDRLLIMSKVEWNDKIATSIWLLIYIIFFILKVIYTTTFYLLYVFVSVQAVCFIFPPTSGSLQGALKTYISLVMAPLVIAVILIILDNTMSYRANSSDYTFSETIRGLVQLLVAGILLLFAPSFAGALLDGRGSATVGNKVVQVLATSMMAVTGLRPLARFIVNAPSKGMGRLFKASGRGVKNLFGQEKKEGHSPLNPLHEDGRKRPSLKERLSSLPWTKRGWNERKLSKRAKQLIGESRKNKLNLKKYSLEEKAKAVETARTNPKKYGIRRDTYREILREVSREARKVKESEKRSSGSSAPIKKRTSGRGPGKSTSHAPSNPAFERRGMPKGKKRANADFLEQNLKRAVLLDLAQTISEEEGEVKAKKKGPQNSESHEDATSPQNQNPNKESV